MELRVQRRSRAKQGNRGERAKGATRTHAKEIYASESARREEVAALEALHVSRAMNEEEMKKKCEE